MRLKQENRASGYCGEQFSRNTTLPLPLFRGFGAAHTRHLAVGHAVHNLSHIIKLFNKAVDLGNRLSATQGDALLTLSLIHI